MTKRGKQILDQAKAVRQERDSVVHTCLLEVAEEAILTKEMRKRIVDASALELREMMATKQVRCEDVVRLYCHRAHRLGLQQSNSVTEEFYDEAVKRAKEIDQLPPEIWQDKETYPLLGVPVSVKECINMAGTITTAGCAVRCSQRTESDGFCVALIREAGAIPFVKTNVPQCLYLPASGNHIWGESLCPWDVGRTVGGSSGGEGGVLGARASPLGIGSDIGGSSRIPALFCGVSGFKPTPTRISAKGRVGGFTGGFNGQIAIPSVIGPMARSVADIAAVMDVWLNEKMFELDPMVPPSKFDRKMFEQGPGRPLRIGFFMTDKWFEPCSAAVRAVQIAVKGLRDAGHHVEPFDIPDALNGWEVARLYFGIIAADGNLHEILKALDGEPLYRDYRPLAKLSNISNFWRPLIRAMLRHSKEHRAAHILRKARSGGISARYNWELCADLERLKAGWLQLLDDKKYDAILFPGLPLPAFPLGTAGKLALCLTYTFLGNLIRFPAMVLCTTQVREDEQEYPHNTDRYDREAQRAMANSAGLPMGVHVMTRPYRDELCLFVANEVQKACPFEPLPPMVAKSDPYV